MARAMLNRQLPELVPRSRLRSRWAIKMRVVAYLERMRLAIQLHNREGTISMPELVNQDPPERARRRSPPRRTRSRWLITETRRERRRPVRKVVKPDGRSARSRRGSELDPEAAEGAQDPRRPGTLTFAFSGEAKLQAGPVTATADKDGGSVTVKEGDASVTGKARSRAIRSA